MRPRRARRVPNWLLGLATVAAAAIGLWLAASGQLPWSHDFELRAVIARTQGMGPDSPVRIAGVNVGRVTSVEHYPGLPDQPGAAVVTMEIADEGLPVHTDATLSIRPRLFLEGNYFVDLHPGTPSAPAAGEGYAIPITNTRSPVQLDEVLTTAQSDVRAHVRTVLDELGNALVRHGGARGLNDFLRSAPAAFRYTARVNEAVLGTRPHDLGKLVRNFAIVAAALDRDPSALAGLVSRLNTVSGALARERRSLERAVAELPRTIRAARPALAAINDSLPFARAFAREALPGVRALPAALDAGTPLVRQVRALLGPAEAGGLARRLRPTVPRLIALERGTLPFLGEARSLASCFNQVVVPWANMTVPDPETPATGEIFKETSYGLVGISGESRSYDANGPYARVLVGSGSNLVVFPPLAGTSEKVVGVTPLPILGERPSLGSAVKPPFRPDVPCETQEPPNLDAGEAGAPPEQHPLDGPAGAIDPPAWLEGRVRAVAGRLEAARRLLGPAGDSVPPAAARRAARLQRGAGASLERALARALGWQPLLHLEYER